MSKKYIFATSNYDLNNPPKGVTVLQFDTETNTFGIYNNKKPVASVLVQAQSEENTTFEFASIPKKLSEFQNDTNFITKNDIPESIDADYIKAVLKFYTTSYSAFQVMPNKVAITNYSVKVPACTEHKFTLRSAQPIENNDVVIDWGDGCIEAIADGKYEWKSGKQYDLSHDYSSSMTKDIQTFIVKIYGKDYYTFRSNEFPNNNLISRIFDTDLPIASHIGNFASMCFGATRLIKVEIPHSTKYVTTAFNFSSTFESCTNLVSVTGFEDSPLRHDCLISNIFNKCKSLTTTDFAIPACAMSIAGIFSQCSSLSNAKRLMPLCGVLGAGKINITNAWLNVPDTITDTIPSILGGSLAD